MKTPTSFSLFQLKPRKVKNSISTKKKSFRCKILIFCLAEPLQLNHNYCLLFKFHFVFYRVYGLSFLRVFQSLNLNIKKTDICNEDPDHNIKKHTNLLKKKNVKNFEK